MKSISWPPVLRNGRLTMEQGAEATRTLVMQTLGDLQQNPFNTDGLSLGDLTFRVDTVVRARVHDALRRLQKIITVQAVSESKDAEGRVVITVDYVDKETRTHGSVMING